MVNSHRCTHGAIVCWLSEDCLHCQRARADHWQKMASFLMSCIAQRDGKTDYPPFIPARVKVARHVWEDFRVTPTQRIVVLPGEYEAHCNRFGAVTVDCDGTRMGLRLNEFEVLSWKPNPHYQNKENQ